MIARPSIARLAGVFLVSALTTLVFGGEARTWQSGEYPSRARPPELVPYPSQTALEGASWIGAKPAGLPKGAWRLQSAPQGLQVDPKTGQARWEKPVAGFHVVAVTLADGERELPLEWCLLVVKNDIPDVRIYSTRYLDYVMPAKYAAWMGQVNLAPVIDAVWERMRDEYGLCPEHGKQAIKYAPDMGGGAHSGNPVMMGPGWFNDDRVDSWGWMLHIPVHEFGHDFHGRTNIGPIISGANPSLDRYFHHGMELTEVAIMTRVAQNPQQFHLEGVPKLTYLEYYKRQVQNGLRRADPFRKWIASGNDPARFEGDTYGVGETMCYELCQRFGPEVLERTMCLFRPDALPRQVYDSADTEIKRQTLLCCMLSSAADRDLKAYFLGWGFKVDSRYFDEAAAPVKQALAQLPPPDVAGWSYCPKNDKLYRLTPWPSSFRASETLALGVRGHLAPVRDAEESAWLSQRFAGRGPLWIGLSDEGSEGTWRRLDGTEPGFTHWADGEPNGGTSENAAVINFSTSGPRWVDVNAADRFLGIIEIPAPAAKKPPARQ